MILRFRPLPAVWPGPTIEPVYSPFKASWSDTLTLLDRELSAIGVTEDPWLAVDLEPHQLRIDGQPRSGARARTDRVILSIVSARGDLSFPCSAFSHAYYRSAMEGWQHNVRAIALGLEALRKVDRYGITARNEQYQGFRELGSGIPMGAPLQQFTAEGAARYIAEMAGDPNWAQDVLDDPGMAKAIYRDAVRLHHPDVGGDPVVMQRLNEAMAVLDGRA